MDNQLPNPQKPSRFAWIASLVVPMLAFAVLDDYWALKAWALAEAGRTSEVSAAVENAIRHTNPKSRPAMAATYHRIGMAMQAMGNESASAGYLKQAQDFDPHGRWSALAKAASGERGAFRA